MRILLCSLLLGVVLLGCDRQPPPKTVFDPQLQAVQKARAVEGQLQQAAEQQRTQIESSEDGRLKSSE